MSLTLEQARDEMSARFKTAWDASAFASKTVLWDDVGAPPPNAELWVRHSIRHADGYGAALGNRLFRRTGTIWVQLHAPTGEGFTRLDQMGMVAQEAYEGQATPGGAWFRNVRAREAGVDGAFQRLNVLVDFEYDEVR